MNYRLKPIENYEFGIINLELRVTNYEFGVMNLELLIPNRAATIRNSKLVIQNSTTQHSKLLNASAYILICFIIANRPLERVGERWSFSPISSIK